MVAIGEKVVLPSEPLSHAAVSDVYMTSVMLMALKVLFSHFLPNLLLLAFGINCSSLIIMTTSNGSCQPTTEQLLDDHNFAEQKRASIARIADTAPVASSLYVGVMMAALLTANDD